SSPGRRGARRVGPHRRPRRQRISRHLDPVKGADRAAAAFDVAGSIVSVEPHPTGHINDAFLVSTDGRRYLLQRLNPSVFPDPDAVMANIVTVTTHLRSKGEPTLTLVAERDGR